jgi:hypothetical protein
MGILGFFRPGSSLKANARDRVMAALIAGGTSLFFKMAWFLAHQILEISQLLRPAYNLTDQSWIQVL